MSLEVHHLGPQVGWLEFVMSMLPIVQVFTDPTHPAIQPHCHKLDGPGTAHPTLFHRAALLSILAQYLLLWGGLQVERAERVATSTSEVAKLCWGGYICILVCFFGGCVYFQKDYQKWLSGGVHWVPNVQSCTAVSLGSATTRVLLPVSEPWRWMQVLMTSATAYCLFLPDCLLALHCTKAEKTLAKFFLLCKSWDTAQLSHKSARLLLTCSYFVRFCT